MTDTISVFIFLEVKKEKMKLYKVVKDWAKAEEVKYEDGREVSLLVIGEYDKEDYIIVDIYSDILGDILDNQSEYDIRIAPGKEPMMTVLRDNDIVFINKDTAILKREVNKAIKEISPGILFNAYVEVRNNMGNKNKLSNAFQILEGMLNQATGKALNHAFIGSVLKEYLETEFYPTDKESKEYLRAMDYDDILKLILEIKSCQLTENLDSITDEYIREFVGDNPSKLNEIKKSINLELEYRVFAGQLIEI